MKIAGVVMAGGESIRMGCDKATLHRSQSTDHGTVEPRTWLERQLGLLDVCGLEPLAVSWNRVRPTPALPSGVRLIRDRVENAGPMAGLEAALAELSSPLVFILAVDLQRMNRDVVSQLITRAETGIGVIPLVGTQPEPLSAIYPLSALPEIIRRLHRREFSMRRLALAGIDQGWLSPWPVPADCVADFANWNQPSDLDS
jgi:molybdopterin-guanine dinucleotide biosynthesis protein A